MKKILKLSLVFVLTLLIYSCSGDKNTLTKAYVLEHLKQCEIKRPNVMHYNISKSNHSVPKDVDITLGNVGTNEFKHLMKLVKEGYLKMNLIASANNTSGNYDSYTFSVLPKAQEFVLASNSSNKMKFVMYETKVVSVENMEVIDDVKANVTVTYKKFKTPFYIEEYDVSTNQNNPVKPESYTEVLTFRKSNTNGWKYCQ